MWVESSSTRDYNPACLTCANTSVRYTSIRGWTALYRYWQLCSNPPIDPTRELHIAMQPPSPTRHMYTIWVAWGVFSVQRVWLYVWQYAGLCTVSLKSPNETCLKVKRVWMGGCSVLNDAKFLYLQHHTLDPSWFDENSTLSMWKGCAIRVN